MLKKIVCLLFSIFVLSSCNVSFPKETLEQDAVKLIKEETQKDTSVYRYGSTLYLDVCFDDGAQPGHPAVRGLRGGRLVRGHGDDAH